MPLFLKDNFILQDYRIVHIDDLFVGLAPISGGNAFYVKITQTPHYMFVRSKLFGEPGKPAHGYLDYAHYVSVNPRNDAVKSFSTLIESIKDSGYDSAINPIFVFRSWRRLFPLKRWDVADGFHRLAVLAALGKNAVPVVTLRSNKSIAERIFNRCAGHINR